MSACKDCEARARYMAADPEAYRADDPRCAAHQVAAIIVTLETENAQLRNDLVWYGLLAKTARRPGGYATWNEKLGTFYASGKAFGPVQFANGLPVETKELRDALEALLGGE